MKITESRLRKIIRNVIAEQYDDEVIPYQGSLYPSDEDDSYMYTDEYESQMNDIDRVAYKKLCDQKRYFVSDMAKRACEDPVKGAEFLDLLSRFERDVYAGPSEGAQWIKNEASYMNQQSGEIVADLYHMCITKSV